MAFDPTIYIGNDYIFKVGPINAKASPSLAVALQTGITITAFLSTSNAYNATAINAALSLTLTEDGTTGEYAGVFEAADITTYLAGSIGSAVFLHIVKANDFRKVIELVVADPRTD